MSRVALLDGDIFAFEVAAGAEEAIHWGEDLWTLHAFENPAVNKLVNRIERLLEFLEADDCVVALTSKTNWRHKVLDTYKMNRLGQRKPMLLNAMKDSLKENFETVIVDDLEADDVLGIMQTEPREVRESIIVTKDKDLQTIPGMHCVLKNGRDPEVFEVDETTADNWHLIQALAGDSVDGYSGCPGIGMETASKIITTREGVEPYEHTFKSGPRKDTTETRWAKTEMASAWDALVSHYRKNGLGEEEALTQARVARILRHSDYDTDNKEVILWTP